MKCKSSFAAGGPRSPLSGSGSRSEMRCPRQCEPRGTEWGPQPSAPGPAAPPAETAESGCAPRGCAPDAAGRRPHRGFKCIPAAGARGSGSEFCPAQPPLGVLCSRGSRAPLPDPAARWAAGWGQAPGSRSSWPGPGPRRGAAPGPSRRLRLEKKSDFLSTLLRLESGIGRKLLQHPGRAFAVSPRFAEEKQLPPKSCLPLPPKAPRSYPSGTVLPVSCASSWGHVTSFHHWKTSRRSISKK
ncbi:translation initiation factor IF-2-like [Equus quagga]|uniref:translation initiation factor IF-2-like n=1 Tax=Equus quagga TaxID=89248 RepID=UPI001EE2D758|nr:translation initiation factor IF-2-like [Equus quagga]